MNSKKQKRSARLQRHRRIRSKIFGTANRPRLCVFRSLRFLEVQLIDDEKGQTLAAARAPLKESSEVGKAIALKAKEQQIKKAVFDRGGYSYHGHVHAVAEGARKEGLFV